MTQVLKVPAEFASRMFISTFGGQRVIDPRPITLGKNEGDFVLGMGMLNIPEFAPFADELSKYVVDIDLDTINDPTQPVEDKQAVTRQQMEAAVLNDISLEDIRETKLEQLAERAAEFSKIPVELVVGEGIDVGVAVPPVGTKP